MSEGIPQQSTTFALGRWVPIRYPLLVGFWLDFFPNLRSETTLRKGGLGPMSEIEDIRIALRGCELRATAARIAVLQQLNNAKSPVTHADLSKVLVPLGFDKATVFRVLTDLTGAGLISRTELGDHVWRFEILDPSEVEGQRHPHFVCTDCGDVSCLAPMEFTAKSRAMVSAIGQISQILIKGLCSDCEGGVA